MTLFYTATCSALPFNPYPYFTDTTWAGLLSKLSMYVSVVFVTAKFTDQALQDASYAFKYLLIKLDLPDDPII